MNENFLLHLEERLRVEALPGPRAQFSDYAHKADMQARLHLPDSYKEAAVCILLYQNERQDLSTALMQRPASPYAHSRQVSWPGGRRDPEDKGLRETALRELQEEFGIASQEVQVLGKLSSLYIPVSNFLVQPFVGLWQGEQSPRFRPDPAEVEELLPLPLWQLFDSSYKRRGDIAADGGMILKDMPYYAFHERKVWGATAMIINEFIALAKPLWNKTN